MGENDDHAPASHHRWNHIKLSLCSLKTVRCRQLHITLPSFKKKARQIKNLKVKKSQITQESIFKSKDQKMTDRHKPSRKDW